ncbi:polysaccharide biosynthesis protein [Tolypothrix sp. FACHB-123]|uniref:polysaccharide biosynthesis protein n=1 Tax=Tolypothrix sp. FACHB-123 TaxID=2692868 RepID=UPI0016864588|nr:nucleoside-diphosphate sugar epimerase/dehydratase [Tolypothrix sp. FACHB-123]MBD2355865.1 polysaccharide biosynthesis protein [Tolypothrix sp. FACHB-123]
MNYPLFKFHLAAQKFSNTFSRKLLNLRNRDLFICDLILFVFTPLLALIIRLDGNFSLQEYMRELGIATILFLSVKLTLFWSLGFYKRYWRYASIEELIYIGMLVLAAVIIQNLLFDAFYYLPYFTLEKLPHSLPFIEGLLSFIFIGGLRFSVRAVARGKRKPKAVKSGERVLVVGAGYAGVALVQEMQRNPQLGFYPVAYIDDNPEKLNLKICGIPVVGDRWQIPEFVKSLQIQKVVIAMPTVSGKVIRDIVDICQATGIQTNTLPGVHQILNGRVRVDAIRDVRIEDLLRRECVETDIEKVASFLQGKKVLVTGAGGSIGSELCRQIFKCCPAEIIMVGHGENSVFNIQQELEQVSRLIKQDSNGRQRTPYISAFIADIRFQSRLEEAFKQFQPDVIFHAAAHKHVPLMEINAAEAITNNVLGTKNLLELAKQYDVENFIMISTDKAVNPTNIMGASKRVAEMLVLQAAKDNNKAYNVVRFGNVLGSRGSVVPTFKKQIAAGGPVTVTHPEIRRYFMTIPEAVQLVLQASVLGRTGELLMLNMGEPVKIVDLAEELIRLSGYEVNKDIEIVFTGLRPGEKLFEELFIPGEEYKLTQHEKLLVVKNASLFIPQNLEVTVEKLRKAAEINDGKSIVCLLEQIVPGYKPKSLSDRILTEAQNTISQYPQNVSLRFTSQSKSPE